MTPSELMFGKPLRMKEDIHIKELIDQEMANSYSDNSADLRTQVKNQIHKTQLENKMNFNAKRKEAKQYKIGDTIAIKCRGRAPIVNQPGL